MTAATHWFDLDAFDDPPSMNHETWWDDWRMVARRAKLRPILAASAAAHAIELGAVALGLPLGVASLQFSQDEAIENVRAFAAAAHGRGLRLSVSVGTYEIGAGHGGLCYRPHPGVAEDSVRAAGADVVCALAPCRPTAADTTDALRAKADHVNSELQRLHVLDGQVLTVLDTRYGPLEPPNEWQEDADWLTGLYCAAMSFAFRATGDIRYRSHAREAFQALHELSTVSGVPGVVARHSRGVPPTELGTGRKRWRQAPSGRWWSGDTSRDQLSGHFLGLAVYHDYVADDTERGIVSRDVGDIAGQILRNHLWALDADGQPCTHANFFVAPLLALSIVKIAHHVTGDPQFDSRYRELINPHFFLGHAMKECARQQDPFFQHYQQDSPIYHLLQYEDDPRLLSAYLRCLRLLNRGTRGNGNAYHLVEHAAFQPESRSGQAAADELRAFRPEHLDVPTWRANVERLLRTDADEPPPTAAMRATLIASLTGDRAGLDPDALYLPIQWRAPMEFAWQYHRHDVRMPHGPHVRYSGVDYLIAFWMGRYHGVF